MPTALERDARRWPPNYAPIHARTVLIRGGYTIVDPLGDVLVEPSFAGETIAIAELDRRIIAFAENIISMLWATMRGQMSSVLKVDTGAKSPVNFLGPYRDFTCRIDRIRRSKSMFGLTALELARIQFGFPISFHTIFPAFSIGLASFLAVLEGLWLWKKQTLYRELYQFWSAIFAVNFAMGVVSGLVMASPVRHQSELFFPPLPKAVSPGRL